MSLQWGRKVCPSASQALHTSCRVGRPQHLQACLSPSQSRQTRERSPLFARLYHPPTPLGKHLQEKCLSARPEDLLKPGMNTQEADGGGRRRMQGSHWSPSTHRTYLSLRGSTRAVVCPISDPGDVRDLCVWVEEFKILPIAGLTCSSHEAGQAAKS